MIRLVFLFMLLLVSWSAILVAQSTISSKYFLQQQLQNIDTSLILILPNRSFNPATISEVQIRTETDEFLFNEQQYQLRFSPSSNRIIKAESRLQQLYQQEANEKLSSEKQGFIKAVYDDLLRGYELQRKLVIEKEWLLILQDHERVTEQLSITGKTSPREWLRVQRNIIELETNIERHEESINLLFYQEKLTWDDFIQIGMMPSKVDEILQAINQVTTTIDQELVAAEIELENAERRKIIDFVQLEYSRSPEDLLREKLSVGASFILPFWGDRKLKIEELTIEELTLKAKNRLQQQRKKQVLKRLQRDLLLKYDEWQRLGKGAKILQQQANLVIERVNQSEQATPLLLLEERSNQSEMALDRLEVEMEIYELYLEILEKSEVLFQGDGMRCFYGM